VIYNDDKDCRFKSGSCASSGGRAANIFNACWISLTLAVSANAKFHHRKLAGQCRTSSLINVH